MEVLSDLVFWRSGLTAPRVRKSKLQQDSDLGRLSIRDLLWYCYLDQDEIDSSFFHLDENGNPFKRLKSRDVLRYVIGFHDEHVAELEAELDQLRGERQAMVASIDSLNRALKEVGVDSEEQILARARDLRASAEQVQSEITAARALPMAGQTSHAADSLREEAVRLSENLAEIDASVREIRLAQDRDILVVNIHKLVNGKSAFGVGESRISVGAIVIDDAHACLSFSAVKTQRRLCAESRAWCSSASRLVWDLDDTFI